MADLTVEIEQSMVNNIRENIKNIKFGSYGAVLRVHEQTIVDVTYTKTESQREYVQTIPTGDE